MTFKEFFHTWTQDLLLWLTNKFSSIEVDLTPVEDKLDDVQADVADVKDAVENIDLSSVAKQGTDATVTLTGVDAQIGDVAEVLDYIENAGLPEITAIAKQGSNVNATLSDTQTAATNASTYALAAKNGIVDGNDTAVSVAKEVRSEVGTGSDTAAETGTLFAVVKWVKDKVKSIYNAVTDSTNGLSAIKTSADNAASEATAAKTAAQAITIPTDYAKAGSGTNVTNTDLKSILNDIATTMYKGVPIESLSGHGTSAADPYTLEPNTWNQVSTAVAANSSLFFAKGTDIADVTNVYMVRFALGTGWGSNSEQVAFKNGANDWSLSWNGGSVPEWTAGNTYEISIVDNIACWIEIEPAP